MTCVQLGLAVAVLLFDRMGPEGAGWVRLVWAAVIFALVARPRPWRMAPENLLACLALGVVTAGITLLFMYAVERLPLGTASALEFLGPLGVAVARSNGRRALIWPVLAAVGVLLLTEPWQGEVDALGVAFALGAAVCWALYILLTQRVGDAVSGLEGLAISMPVAAVTATILVGHIAIPTMSVQNALLGLGLAALLPVIPFALELSALRRLTTAAFGTLMSLEPAIALLLGLIVLQQQPGWWPVVGVLFVVLAGIGAERTGARDEGPPDPEVSTGEARFVVP